MGVQSCLRYISDIVGEFERAAGAAQRYEDLRHSGSTSEVPRRIFDELYRDDGFWRAVRHGNGQAFHSLRTDKLRLVGAHLPFPGTGVVERRMAPHTG